MAFQVVLSVVVVEDVDDREEAIQNALAQFEHAEVKAVYKMDPEGESDPELVWYPPQD